MNLSNENGGRRGFLAARAVPASTLRNWEADQGFPGLPALLRLAAALGVRVERSAERVEDQAGEEQPPGSKQPSRCRKGPRRP